MFDNIITVIRCNKQMNAGNKSLDRGLMILHELTNTGGGLNEGAYLLSENVKNENTDLKYWKISARKKFSMSANENVYTYYTYFLDTFCCLTALRDRMVRFLRGIAYFLHLPQESRGDERALDDLRALAQRGFRPVTWEFRERWCQSANALPAQLGLVPLTPVDLERVKQGLIVHTGMLAHPQVIAALLNWLLPVEHQRSRHLWSRTSCQRSRHLWPRTSCQRLHTPRPNVGESQSVKYQRMWSLKMQRM